MQYHSKLYALAVLLLVPTCARAHFLWIVADPVTKAVHVEVAESPSQDVAPILTPFKSVIQTTGVGPLTDVGHGKAFSARLTAGTVATAILTYGLHGEDLVLWFAKATTNLKSAASPAGLRFEILVTVAKDGILAASAYRTGKLIPGAKFEAFNNGTSLGVLSTDKSGHAVLPRLKKGILSLGIVAVEAVTGDYKGQHFKDKMNMATLSLPIR